MSVWNHLRREAERQERQARAVKKVEQLGKDIMDYAHGVGELHRKHGRKPEKEEEPQSIDLNDSDTQWALACEAVGSDYWED